MLLVLLYMSHSSSASECAAPFPRHSVTGGTWGGVEGHPGEQGGPKCPERDSPGKKDHLQPFVMGSMCEWQELGNGECQGMDVGLILRVGNQQ